MRMRGKIREVEPCPWGCCDVEHNFKSNRLRQKEKREWKKELDKQDQHDVQ